MTTALTVFPSTIADTLLTTADKMVENTTGGGVSSKNTKIGQSTGYGEVYSQGTTNAWAAAGSIGSASGHGWIDDNTTLEGQQILAGNWTPTVSCSVSAGTITADIYVRAFIRSSGGTLTQIGGNMVLSNVAITTTNTAHTFAATSLPLQAFNTGQKLYIDIWLNITVNATLDSAANFNIRSSNSATQGNVAHQIVTPGYQAQPAGGGPTQTRITNRHHNPGRVVPV